jgi:Carboxypeptidase regulatory-like domain
MPLVRGTVKDGTGRPVEGAHVYFLGGPATFPDVAALTDARGGFVLAAPFPGSYRLGCRAEGFAVADRLVVAQTESPSPLEIVLSPEG